MSKSRLLLDQLRKTESPNVTYVDEHFPVVMKKGKGMYVSDVDGNRYLDFTACFGVLALGHRPKIVLSALREQSAKMIHGMGDVHPTEPKIRFLTELAKHLPYAHPNLVLGSSGADAVETALKTAVLATGKTRFLSFDGGYHGLTTGPLRLNNNRTFVDGFEQWLEPRATIIPFPMEEQQSHCLNLIEDEMKKRQYAALVMEPIQGRGGDRAFDNEFVAEVANLAKKYSVVLIFDEVFTGFGRTGKFFAFEHSGVVPDLLCLGKAIGGGLPLSACAGQLLEVWGKSTGEARHTSTFLGHPLACATGLAAVKEIAAKLPLFFAQLDSIEKEFKSFLADYMLGGMFERNPLVLTGKGFMRGLRFHSAHAGFAAVLSQKLLVQGFITLPCGQRGDVLSLTPPLNATASEFRQLFSAINKLLYEQR